MKRSVKNTIRIAVMEEKQKALRREIATQAIEYQRRLAELNHAHEKQVSDQQNYVSNDSYKGWQGEINTFRNEVSRFIASTTARSTGSTGTRDTYLQILVALSIAGSAIVGIIALWKH